MFSRGAINAQPFSGLALNEGNFVVVIAADQAIAIEAEGRFPRRASLASDAAVTAGAAAAVNRRRQMVGVTSVAIDAVATMTRRPSAVGVARIEIPAAARFPRRVQVITHNTVEIIGEANGSWRRLHQGSRDRQIMVRKEHRTIIVPSGRKDV
jgi:hypothetical protein